jgi:hypothetical protein
VFTDEQIAIVAYAAANNGYNHAIGDPWVDPVWTGLPPWHREAVIDGVRMARAGLSARELHGNWFGYYTRLGWVHGEVKNPDGDPPTHPCLLPWDELPAEMRVKDILFREFVAAMTRVSQWRTAPGAL